jgi:nucleotide-binding universal stress UspA family protein
MVSLTDRRGSGVAVVGELIEGRPADVLTTAACDAQLLVLGSHGQSRVHHGLSESVSEDCIRMAGAR